MPNQKILIVAGESSGDQHGAALIRELRRMEPNLEIYALGGPRMKEAGANILVDMLAFSVVGLLEVIKQYGVFQKILDQVLFWTKEHRPAAVVLIDFPGFNLKLAGKLKKQGLKIIYFVSPQIWAWGKNRIWKIKKLVDRMLVLFRFEESLYRDAGIDVTYVGHPILEHMPDEKEQEALRQRFPELSGKKIVGLLPGSRPNEICTHLPIMLETARHLLARDQKLVFVLGLASGASPQSVQKITDKYPDIPLTVIRDGAHPTLALSRIVIVAAGTITLETAFFKVPMVIVYRISWLTWCLGRLVVDVPFLGMVNIVAGCEVAPECLQTEANPSVISSKIEEILEDDKKREYISKKLEEVKNKLDSSGASRKTAIAVLDVLKS